MGEGKCSPGPWKAIENSWQYTTIYDAHDREICRLDLERFEDLNEETQDKYEAIQRADAAAIVRACDHLAALRRAKAEGAREMIKIVKANRADQRVADDLNNTVSFDSFNEVLDAITREIDARAAQIEEGEDLK